MLSSPPCGVEQAHAEQALREQLLEALDVRVHDLVGVHVDGHVAAQLEHGFEHFVRAWRAQA